MLQRSLKFSKSVVCRRNFTMLNSYEEFTHSMKLTPKQFSQITVKESILNNGIKIISSDSESSKIAKVQVTITCGSNAESITQKGSAHLASICAFNGNAKTSGFKLAYDLENLGATVKSFSDREKIVYEITVLPDKIESALFMFADALKFNLKPVYLIKEAKDIAQTSYDKFISNPVDQTVESLYEAAYGELTPLGGSLYAESLYHLGDKDFSSFVYSNFKSGNIVVSSSGISHEAIKQLVETVFIDYRSGATSPMMSTYQGGFMKVKKDMSGHTYLGLGFEVSPQQAASCNVLMNILSKSFASKNNVQPIFSTFSKSGLMGFVVYGETENATNDLKQIISNIKVIAKNCPKIDNIVKQIKLDSRLALEGDDKTSALRELTLKGNTVKALDSVSTTTVSVAANAALTSVPSYAVLGKTYGTPSFNEILSLLK